jgi:hypothetical protein
MRFKTNSYKTNMNYRTYSCIIVDTSSLRTVWLSAQALNGNLLRGQHLLL